MSLSGNHVTPTRPPAPAPAPPPSASGDRCPRRLVLLRDGEASPVESVLAQYHGKEIVGSRLHADLQRHAEGNPGRFVAAEWEGPRGWIRFLWCRK